MVIPACGTSVVSCCRRWWAAVANQRPAPSWASAALHWVGAGGGFTGSVPAVVAGLPWCFTGFLLSNNYPQHGVLVGPFCYPNSVPSLNACFAEFSPWGCCNGFPTPPRLSCISTPVFSQRRTVARWPLWDCFSGFPTPPWFVQCTPVFCFEARLPYGHYDALPGKVP